MVGRKLTGIHQGFAQQGDLQLQSAADRGLSHGASPQGCGSGKAWAKRNRRLAYPEGQARRRYGVSGAGLEGAYSLPPGFAAAAAGSLGAVRRLSHIVIARMATTTPSETATGILKTSMSIILVPMKTRITARP